MAVNTETLINKSNTHRIKSFRFSQIKLYSLIVKSIDIILEL